MDGNKWKNNNHSKTGLVGGFNSSEKYSSNWKSSPSRGENKKYIWKHHLDWWCWRYQEWVLNPTGNLDASAVLRSRRRWCQWTAGCSSGFFFRGPSPEDRKLLGSLSNSWVTKYECAKTSITWGKDQKPKCTLFKSGVCASAKTT